MTKLVDLSAHNAWPHPNLVNALDGMIFRVAYALGRDAHFRMFVANAKAGHIPWSAYHFLKPGDGRAQAEFAMRELDKVGGCPVLFMDREFERGVIASKATADAYIQRLQAAGLVAGTYMSEWNYQSHGATIDWIAKWGSTPPRIWHRHDFWQYAGLKLDRDEFNGTPDELRQLFATGHVDNDEPHEPPVEPEPVNPSKGDAMFNLVPGTAKRTVIAVAGTVLYDRSVNGTRYGFVEETMEFALLGGVGSRYVIADGDYGVYVERSACTVTQNSKNYGA